MEAARLNSNPIGALTVERDYSGSGTVAHTHDYLAFTQAILVNVYMGACIRCIARDVAATPLVVQRQQRIDGGMKWVTQEAGELVDLLSNPNPEDDIADLLEGLVFGLMGAGQAGLAFDPKDKELWYVRGDWIKVKTDAVGKITEYVVSNGEAKSILDFADLIFFRTSNPMSRYYGLPPAHAIQKTILMKLGLDTYLAKWFKNNGFLGTVFSTDQRLDDAQIKAVRKELNSLHAGAENAGRFVIAQGGVTVQQLGNMIKDIVPRELNLMIKEEVAAAYGVPMIYLNSLDGSTYNTSETQTLIYQTGTVHPVRLQIARTFNRQFVRDRYGEDWRVYFDISDTPGLKKDLDKAIERSTKLYSGGIITLNEARDEAGYDPVDNGDEFKAPSPNPFVQAAFNPGGRSFLKLPAREKAEQTPRVERWKAYDAKLTSYENKFEKAMKRFFDHQFNRIVDRLNAITNNGKYMSRIGVLVMKDNLPDDSADRLFDLSAEDIELLREISGDVVDIGRRAANGAAESLSKWNITGTFDVKNPKFDEILTGFQNRIKRVNQTTYDTIKELLKESYQNNESIDDIKKKLTETYDQFNKVRAQTIARTEMNGLVNGASHEAYRQNGIAWEEWLTAPGADNPRHELLAGLDGQLRRLSEPFEVGGDLMLYPGDPSGSAENTINCRCTVIPRPDIED